MKIPTRIFASWEGSPGAVINTETGFIGRIVQFTDYHELLTQSNSGKWVSFAQIPGYKIIVFYSGVIGSGNRLTTHPSIIDTEIGEMAKFYMDTKIKPHLTRFKRYQL